MPAGATTEAPRTNDDVYYGTTPENDDDDVDENDDDDESEPFARAHKSERAGRERGRGREERWGQSGGGEMG